MDVPYKPTKPIQPNQQIYYYTFVDTTDFLSLKEGIQEIFGNILGVSPLDVVVNENGIYPPASPFYGNKKIVSATLIDKFQAINYVRKVLFLNIEKQFLSLQKKWGMQNPRFKNPIKLFPNELDLDSFQILTEEGKPRYYLLTYRYGLESNTLRKIKARVYGLEVHVTLDAYSAIPVSFSYNHRPLDTKKAITQAYLISPYTYDGLQDVAVAYLADYEKGLVAPYYLQMPLTAEQKKAAKETVEDTFRFLYPLEKVVGESNIETEKLDNSMAIPACEFSRKLPVPKPKYVTYHIYWNNETVGRIVKSVPKKTFGSYIADDMVKYIYHDKEDQVHELGYARIHSTQRHISFGKLSNIPNDKIELVYIKDIPSYHSESAKFRFITWNSDSQRWYINPACLAGLLGAMIEENIEDLGFNGFSDINGESKGGSTSHINGVKGDLRYLSTNNNGEATLLTSSHFEYNRQVRFNNALYKFLWGRTKKLLSEEFVLNLEKVILPHCSPLYEPPHDNHLHIQGFDFGKVESN